ncbi:hypothetical protein [Humisphaera borealis]|uniref:Uncharacterized protein n=1 Tax=Humisphaera borealis TaxID=2807512 RepID=A0A7M2WXC2_9BACT|nr:hypothetical protein [Humisphaera borealis]QOV90145.1 hypothetical protein IPV69_01865 [Humisphaera borealis]
MLQRTNLARLFLSVIACSVVLAPAAVLQAQSTPAFSGEFTSEKLRLTLAPAADGQSFSGTVTLGSKSFPVTAKANGNTLTGTFTSGGESFAFTATRNGDVVTFLTGRTTYTLSAAPAGRVAAPAAGARYVRMTRVNVPDLLCKQTASTVLIPSDWKLEGGIIWRQNVAYPTAVHGRIFNPKGTEQMGFYPSLLFNDGVRESAANNARIAGPEAMAAAAAGFPEGSMYMGNEVRRLNADPVAVLKEFALPRYRKDLAQARIIDVVNQPELAKLKFEALGSPQGAEVKAVRVRFAYDLNGVAMEEDFLCFWGSMPILPPIVSWGMEFQSFRAEKGKLDATMPLFQAINRSGKVDMKWFAGVLDVQAQMHRDGMQAIADAGRLSKYIAARSDEVNKMITEGYWKAQQSNDRIYDGISQSIRGTQRFTDPYDQRPIELPGGYDHAYMSPRGEVILTNDPLFNPGVEFKEDWKELPKAR